MKAYSSDIRRIYAKYVINNLKILQIWYGELVDIDDHIKNIRQKGGATYIMSNAHDFGHFYKNIIFHSFYDVNLTREACKYKKYASRLFGVRSSEYIVVSLQIFRKTNHLFCRGDNKTIWQILLLTFMFFNNILRILEEVSNIRIKNYIHLMKSARWLRSWSLWYLIY